MEPILQFSDVTYRYRSGHAALDRASFAIRERRKTAMVGANGAGKSTAVFHMNGLYRASSGEVAFRGAPLDGKLRERMVDHVGVVFQDPDDQIISLTVFDDVAFGLWQRGVEAAAIRERVEAYLSLLGIAHLAGEHPNELSFGQRRLVGMAGVLVLETEIVVFDEPMAFLDPHGKKELHRLLDRLSAEGRTVVVTTHDMQLVADWADDVIVMHAGRCLGIVTPNELFADKPLLAQARLELPPLAALADSLWTGDRLAMPLRLDELQRWLERGPG